MCAKRIKFLMTRLSVCSLGVSCNEMIDTPMLLVVTFTGTNLTKSGIKLFIFALEQKLKVHWNGIQKTFLLSYYASKSEQAENSLVLPT